MGVSHCDQIFLCEKRTCRQVIKNAIINGKRPTDRPVHRRLQCDFAKEVRSVTNWCDRNFGDAAISISKQDCAVYCKCRYIFGRIKIAGLGDRPAKVRIGTVNYRGIVAAGDCDCKQLLIKSTGTVCHANNDGVDQLFTLTQGQHGRQSIIKLISPNTVLVEAKITVVDGRTFGNCPDMRVAIIDI